MSVAALPGAVLEVGPQALAAVPSGLLRNALPDPHRCTTSSSKSFSDRSGERSARQRGVEAPLGEGQVFSARLNHRRRPRRPLPDHLGRRLDRCHLTPLWLIGPGAGADVEHGSRLAESGVDLAAIRGSGWRTRLFQLSHTVLPTFEMFNVNNSDAIISTVTNNVLSASAGFANSVMQPRMIGVGAQVKW